MNIKWNDPFYHSIGQLPIVIPIAIISPLAAGTAALFFWLGRETGQKREEYEPGWRGTLETFKRPFISAQSAAEWITPGLVAIIVGVLAVWFKE